MEITMNVVPIWQREPVAILAALQAALALALAFGLDLTADQVGTIVALSSVLLGVTARSQVTPTL